MVAETFAWDSSKYLETPEDMALYLDAVLNDVSEHGDASVLHHALGVIARARGMTEIARETGLSRESLYKALSEDGNPSFATVLKVLSALNIQLRASVRTGSEAA
jgi:probable addiction module antidote protein